jgi:hypothetical protein
MQFIICSHCGQANPPLPHGGAATVCGHCGANLAGPVTAAEITNAVTAEPETITHAEPVADEPFAETDPHQPDAYESIAPARFPFEVVFFLTALMLLLGVGTVTVALLVFLQRNSRDQAAGRNGGRSDSPFVSNSNSTGDAPHRWLKASQGALRIGATKVEIVRAEYGEVRGKDEFGVVVISPQRYLQVLVRVENSGLKPIQYNSWYGNDFPTADGSVRAQMHDNLARDYPWVLFDDVQRVRWNVPAATIEPRKYTEDVMIFQLPEGGDLAAVEYFRLELPAAATGQAGFYYFELPRDMIDEF